MDARLKQAFEHHAAGRLVEAEPLYQAVALALPGEAAVWHGWGLLAAQRGETVLAVQRLEHALKLAPAQAEFWHTLGRVHAHAGDHTAAVAAFQQAIAINPKAAPIWSRLTAALRQTRRIDEAIAAGEQATRLAPGYAAGHNHLGNALCDAGRDEEAAASFHAALRLQPDFAEACTNLGSTLTRLRQYDEALQWCDRAVALAPGLPEAHNNRAITLAAVGRLDDAVAACRRAVELRPDYAAAWSNLGVNLCNANGDADEAIRAGARAVALQPADPVIHVIHGMTLLTLSRLEPGWAEHEFRFRANPRISSRTFAGPRWTGEELPRGTILLHAEQGFGDTIQFARFVPMVARRVANVIVECQPELVDLLRLGLSGQTSVIARGESLPHFDVHCPLMSLPVPLKIHNPSLIPATPHLRADPGAVESWRDRLGSGRHYGLVWAGRPTHTNDANRSAPLAAFAPLAAVLGVTFHGLQKGPAAMEALSPPPGLPLRTHGDRLHTWSDTAAAIAALDGVIAVDTAAAHLAGAMGKPVWLLLPFVPDWRWMRTRPDSPWYPSIQIYRQQTWVIGRHRSNNYLTTSCGSEI